MHQTHYGGMLLLLLLLAVSTSAAVADPAEDGPLTAGGQSVLSDQSLPIWTKPDNVTETSADAVAPASVSMRYRAPSYSQGPCGRWDNFDYQDDRNYNPTRYCPRTCVIVTLFLPQLAHVSASSSVLQPMLPAASDAPSARTHSLPAAPNHTPTAPQCRSDTSHPTCHSACVLYFAAAAAPRRQVQVGFPPHCILSVCHQGQPASLLRRPPMGSVDLP
jgi:hypothetical protein